MIGTATPLHWSAGYGQRDVVAELLESGAVQIPNSEGWTPLMWAAEMGHDGVVNLLLSHDYSELDRKELRLGRSALMLAVERDQKVVAKTLLLNGAKQEENNSGATPLMVAAKYGYEDVVKVLLNFDKSKINEKMPTTSSTALSLAVLGGHHSVVRILLNSGALQIKDRLGWTPLMWASQEGYDTIVRELLTYDASQLNTNSTKEGVTALGIAVDHGRLLVVRTLLEKGAKQSIDDEGYTPLMVAAKKQHDNISRLLLTHNIELLDRKSPIVGETALHTLSITGKEELVRTMIKNGANVDVQERNGNTPLLAACQEGYHGIVKTLLDAGANPNICDFDGLSPIHSAAQEDRWEVMKILLDHGCDPNTVSENKACKLWLSKDPLFLVTYLPWHTP